MSNPDANANANANANTNNLPDYKSALRFFEAFVAMLPTFGILATSMSSEFPFRDSVRTGLFMFTFATFLVFPPTAFLTLFSVAVQAMILAQNLKFDFSKSHSQSLTRIR